ncbi:MAG TPA: hypothetical protein EYP85_10260 [Armatimonadetes bacterium]|nr:hypothetical protein [Armatimonadota bacterium]
MRQKRIGLMGAMLGSLLVAGCSRPQPPPTAPLGGTPVVSKLPPAPAPEEAGPVPPGETAPEQPAEEVIQVTGRGVSPPNLPPLRARLLARRAALADAQRKLAAALYGSQVEEETGTVETAGLVKDYRIVEERFLEDGTCEIVLEAPRLVE